jgi:hypothetical protein
MTPTAAVEFSPRLCLTRLKALIDETNPHDERLRRALLWMGREIALGERPEETVPIAQEVAA